MACTSILGSCNAQTKQQSLEKDKEVIRNIEQNDSKKNNEKINFLDNEKVIFHIGISTNPPILKDDKIYTEGWKYRVTVENITDTDREKFKTIPLETWIQLLEDQNTDWSANLILYDIYEKDAAMLSRRDKKDRWRSFMKEEDISYWKEALSKKR